jgi:hypothetical protein
MVTVVQSNVQFLKQHLKITKKQFAYNKGITMSRPQLTEQENTAIEEWLKKNKVTVCEAGEKTDPEDIEYTFKVGKRGKSK